jgi:hypothetical protein
MKPMVVVAIVFAVATNSAFLAPVDAGPIGVQGRAGVRENPKEVGRLRISEPGVYENYLVDCNWGGGNRVKIMADNVTLRNCEIRNATGNGIGVFANNVLIESCKIHHLLSGTFRDQEDAHGITGDGDHIVIRNCEICYVSGDAVQFSPDRRSWNDILIERCTLWTGPLPADAAGFRKGERPGENAFDSKQSPGNPRSKVTIRNCLMYGWKQPGQINLMAAINAKEHVEAYIENCLFRDNEVCFRLRGPGKRGGALVRIQNCALYESKIGVRMEDRIRDLRIQRLGFGPRIARRYHQVGRGPWPGYENRGEYDAPPVEQLLERGFPIWHVRALTLPHSDV